jgi:hypothetical protein
LWGIFAKKNNVLGLSLSITETLTFSRVKIEKSKGILANHRRLTGGLLVDWRR